MRCESSKVYGMLDDNIWDDVPIGFFGFSIFVPGRERGWSLIRVFRSFAYSWSTYISCDGGVVVFCWMVWIIAIAAARYADAVFGGIVMVDCE